MRFLASLIAGVLLLPLPAMAGPCDAHFKFDGDLADAGGNGLSGQFVDSKGEPIAAVGEFVPGKFGEALRLDGDTTVFSELNLQTETCPQVSVTAWIFLDGYPKNSHVLLSTGHGRGPRMAVSSSNLSSWGGSNEIRAGLAVRPGMWIFVAGVWDYTAGDHRLYWRHRSMEEPLGENKRPPQEGLWIGAYAYGSSMMNRASGILIDDLQVHGKALSEDEIRAIRDAELARAAGCDCGDAPAPAQSGIPPAPVEGPSCSADSDCPDVGEFSGACYSLDGSRAQCYQHCVSDSDCGEGNSCLSVTLPAGTLDRVCTISNSLLPSSGPPPAGTGADQPTPGPLAGTVFATGPGQPSDTVTDTLVDRANENRPPDITYDSEEEGIAAAEAAEARREQERKDNQSQDGGPEQMPAPIMNAVMDLQTMRVTRQDENKGDEYYMVTYELRGRRGQGDRIFTFDYAKQVWPIQTGENWAKKSLEFSVPQGAGRLVFEDLKPFEIYGFVVVVMEANKNSTQERTAAFGFGEFQNEAGVTEVISSAFERAVPRTAALPDYNDTSCLNTSTIFEENANGLIRHFGNYQIVDRGLPKAIRDALSVPLDRANPDRFDGVFWSFYMNAPGAGHCADHKLPPTILPQPGSHMEFKTRGTRFIGEHSQYE